MSSVSFTHWHQDAPEAALRGALALGNFDGVHRGHQALVRALRARADAVAGPAVCVTFDPHPLSLLRPEQFQPVLTTIQHRAELLCRAGADHVIVLHTTRELLELDAADFFREVVRERLQAQAMVEGPNFGFGRDRQGNIDTLRQLCSAASMELTIVAPEENAAGDTISSSRVRNALNAGDIEQATNLLGRRYRLSGKVVEGQRRGRTLGFPTANLADIDVLTPRDGVYAVRAEVEGQFWAAAANIGPNPTFGEQTRKVEVHLLDFDGELYDRVVAVEFVARLRDTRPFAGRDELVAQLQQDIAQARNLAQEEGR